MGSKHNFVSHSLARKLKIVSEICREMKITLADGTTLSCSQKIVGMNWSMGGVNFTSNFHAITLGGYDLVLGVQWLQQVSPIWFDFNKGEVQLRWKNERVYLKQEKVVPKKINVQLENDDRWVEKEESYFLARDTNVEIKSANVKDQRRRYKG